MRDVTNNFVPSSLELQLQPPEENLYSKNGHYRYFTTDIVHQVVGGQSLQKYSYFQILWLARPALRKWFEEVRVSHLLEVILQIKRARRLEYTTDLSVNFMTVSTTIQTWVQISVRNNSYARTKPTKNLLEKPEGPSSPILKFRRVLYPI